MQFIIIKLLKCYKLLIWIFVGLKLFINKFLERVEYINYLEINVEKSKKIRLRNKNREKECEL